MSTAALSLPTSAPRERAVTHLPILRAVMPAPVPPNATLDDAAPLFQQGAGLG
jgi:hypothetical protein